ncbi:MAG: hypothetical protein KBS84_07235 [Treponema sp.]|nr:hypothetical protein [Candidatus Treponema scatequi]
MQNTLFHAENISQSTDYITSAKTQFQFRARLFKAIFGRDTEQSKRWRLELYNALNDSNYTDPDALELNTIENVLYITMKNDISFLVDSQMTLYEQQSTYNPNMPLRGLFYFSQLYQIYLAKNNKILHKSTVVKIPAPNYVVFYNGKREFPDRQILKLSDAFDGEVKSGCFEWTCEMININKDHNSALQKKCKPLYNYVSFVSRVNKSKESGLHTKDAVNEAVEWAIGENLLEGFFKIQKEEILGMILTEYDEELTFCNWFEDGVEEGIEKGREQAVLDSVRSFYSNGVSIDLISKSLNLTPEKVKEIVKDVVLI